MPRLNEIPFTTIIVDLGGQTFQEDLASVLIFNSDPQGLSEAMTKQPGLFGRWAMLEAHAQAIAEEAENRRATTWAELYSYHEAALGKFDEKQRRQKPTVEAVKAAIQKHPQYQAALTAVSKANALVAQLRAGRQAVDRKGEIMIELARNMRSERQAHMDDHLRDARDYYRSGRARPYGSQ